VLKPGQITYSIEAYFLQYHDRPTIILAPLPAGEYRIEIELHISTASDRSIFLKEGRDFIVSSTADDFPSKSFGQSETMKKYYEKVKMKLGENEWSTEISRLLDSTEAAPHRNTIIWNHYTTTMNNMSDTVGAINEIRRSIEIALRRPDDLLSIELLNYGRRDQKYNYLYCERFPEVAATGETRLHRYFREFVCKQK